MFPNHKRNVNRVNACEGHLNLSKQIGQKSPSVTLYGGPILLQTALSFQTYGMVRKDIHL